MLTESINICQFAELDRWEVPEESTFHGKVVIVKAYQGVEVMEKVTKGLFCIINCVVKLVCNKYLYSYS